MEQTLDDLKVENENAEKGQSEKADETQDIPKSADVTPTPAEKAPDEKTDLPDWMQTDAQMPVKKYLGIKKRLKGQLTAKSDEIESLKNKIKEMESSHAETPKQIGVRPKKSDYYSADDPDDSYIDALTDWKLGQAARMYEKQSQDAQQNHTLVQAHQSITKSVDEHYERASQLLSETGIGEDVYQAADAAVRHAIDEAMPGSGDIVTDQILSRLGAGSEKIMYFLGQNTAAINTLKKALSSDQSGLSASMYLGELKAKILTPKKRQSAAPPPPARLQGDANVGKTGDAMRYKKEYDTAHKKGDFQSAFNARKSARQLKIDVKDW